MRRRAISALVLAACLSIPLAGAPASAAVPPELYVNNTRSNCSDRGTGSTESQPFCTIAAATRVATAGQTVYITGTYNERLTVTSSGTPERPIKFRDANWYPGGGPAILSGSAAGITISGQHDIVLQNLRVEPTGSTAAVAVSNSTRITMKFVSAVDLVDTMPAGIQLNGVTDSSFIRASISGQATTGIVMDAATTRVTVQSAWVDLSRTTSEGIKISGPENKVLYNTVQRLGGPAIRIMPGAHNNVIANNTIVGIHGRAIHNTDANNTAIANNSVLASCGTAIRVDGTSTGVSVQNNVIDGTHATALCRVPAGEVGIGLYDEAAGRTTVDYNNIFHPDSHPLYAWQSPMGLAEFQTTSGQAAHDLNIGTTSARIDSANSAAPGWQSIDEDGRVRVDDPNTPNSGVGPIGYADRGSGEIMGQPTVRMTVMRSRTRAGTVVDASASTVWAPLTVTMYYFDFGDGTSTAQTSPIASHVYRASGTYQLTVRVKDSNGTTGQASVSWRPYLTPPRRTSAGPSLPTRNRTAW